MYLSNQSHTHTNTERNRLFEKFSCLKMSTKDRVLLIFGKVIALKKEKGNKKISYFRYNLRKGTRGSSIVCKINAYVWNRQEKSSIFKEFAMRKFRILKTNHENVRVPQIFTETILHKYN